ncbi:efflux RND transporter periplasmic adaptor subunit [uncultured Roseobacter sp.]|uniref:efflux RND transporter periplasmic adaptor subunit n=1 Tax=uncultured Roseobacter sp. TaxID=114847 RepID=UPI002613696F|nr:efflux RND transporter periplasmic adaptor subunit [uncultured Roseobacter sp.]
MKISLAALLGIYVFCAATSVLAQSDEPPVRPAKVFTVVTQSSNVERTYPAIVLPSREVQLTFRVSGRVIDLPVRAAMTVQEGDVIARLDPSDFETNVAQLESQRDQANAELRALRAGARAEEIVALEAAVESAQAQLDQALDQVQRTRELAERGVVATAALEQDEASLRVAEANLQTQIEQLAIGQAGGRPEDIEASEAALRGLEAQLQVARNNLDYATLRAPFEGIIARRDIDNFMNVQAGQNIVLLQTLSTVHVAFDVPGPDVTSLSANGQENITNKVVFDALPNQEFDAEVVEFSVQADTATQTYRGRVSVEVPQTPLILPGMVGRVFSTAPGEQKNLMVPVTAIAANSNGAPFVWLLDEDNRATKREVRLGDMSANAVAVLEGLSAGERIISAGVGKVIEGMQVRPVTRIGG